MKKNMNRLFVLAVIVLSFCIGYKFIKPFLFSVIGTWLADNVEGKFSADTILSLTSGAISSILAFFSSIIVRHFDNKSSKRDDSLYISIVCDSEIPHPISTSKKVYDRRKNDVLEINLADNKSFDKFRYVYAVVKNAGNHPIEHCLIANHKLPCSLKPQDEWKLRFIIPAAVPVFKNRRMQKYSIPFEIEDGMYRKATGAYTLRVNLDKASVDFVCKKHEDV